MTVGKKKSFNTASSKRALLAIVCFHQVTILASPASSAEPFQILDTDNISLKQIEEDENNAFKMLPSDVIGGQELVFQNDESAGQVEITNNLNDRTTFLDQSSGGEATIINNTGGETAFSNQSTASNAFITINNDAKLSFDQQSSASDSRITNNSGGLVTFSGASSAGDAVVTNNGTVHFFDHSSANNALITNNATGEIAFYDEADAGRRNITNNGIIDFFDESSSGEGLIVNNQSGNIRLHNFSTTASADINNNGSLVFNDQTSAAQSSIVNNTTGTILFYNEATADQSIISNNGSITFDNDSSSGNSRLFNNEEAYLNFAGRSTAESSSIVNAGELVFSETSSAGTSIITTSGGGTTRFAGRATGDNAAIHVDQNGTLDISEMDNRQLDIASLVSAGNVTLGRTTLIADQKIVLNDTSHISLVLGYGRLIAEELELQGGTLDLQRSSDLLYEIGKTYSIFYAPTYSGSSFSKILNHDFAFVTPYLDDGAVTLQRNDLSFASITDTKNQMAVANALEYMNPNSLAYRAIISGTAQDARSSFDLLSGELHSSLATALADSSMSFRNAIMGRSPSVLNFEHTRSHQPELWISTSALKSKTDALQTIAATKTDGYAVNIGAEFDIIDQLSVGIVGDYQDSTFKVSERASRADINTIGAGIYLQWQQNGFDIIAGGAYQRHSIETERSLALNALTGTVTSDYSAYTKQFFTRAGYTYNAGFFEVQPYLALSHSINNIDGFRESGLLDAALIGQSMSINTTTGTVGLQAGRSFSINDRYRVDARLDAAWNQNWGDQAVAREVAFTPDLPFYIVGASSDNEYLLMNLKIGVVDSKRFTMNLFYSGVFGKNNELNRYAASAAFNF